MIELAKLGSFGANSQEMGQVPKAPSVLLLSSPPLLLSPSASLPHTIQLCNHILFPSPRIKSSSQSKIFTAIFDDDDDDEIAK